MRNYSGFYQDLSGYYMVFMNYIPSSTLTTKIIFLQVLNDCGVKTRWNIYVSSSPTLTYTITKKLKKFFGAQKPLRVLKLLRVLSGRVLFRVLSDSVLLYSSVIGSFSYFSVIGFFMVLSNRVLFESSVINCSKSSSVTDSSLGLSVLFFPVY